jgi:trk system potassium uptake protein TrkH
MPRRWMGSPFILMYGFLALILIGWLVLSLPISNTQNQITPWLVGLFTATSAVTLTGLILVESGTYWSQFGQSVILILIFIGGLGFMTGTTTLFIIIGRRITLAERLVLRESIGTGRLGGVVRLARNIFLVVAAIQLLGFFALLIRFSIDAPFGTAAWQALFHAVSAFNNAGFDIVPESASLSRFAQDYAIIGIMGLLIMLGSLSYATLVDIVRYRRFSRFTLDTRLVLVTTVALWVLGALIFFVFEFRNESTLSGLPLGSQIADSIFQSFSGRTAGFSTTNFGDTQQQTNFFYSALMFIGGASGSTAGGIKVNTLAILAVAILSSLRGRPAAEAFGRELPLVQVYRALVILALALLAVFGVTLVLTIIEPFKFIDLLFETVSAFATNGLSTGITSDLSKAAQTILVFTMFFGRLGPLTIGLLLAQREERPKAIYRYSQERIKLG